MHPSELGLRPEQAADRALLDAVRPADWSNPTPTGRYHLVVLGGGTAGLVTAVAAASLGARVALVERRLLGGDCLNVGCVPSKAVLRAGTAWHQARVAAGFGLRGSWDTQPTAPFERLRQVRAAIAPHDSAERLRSLGVHVFFGDARFASDRHVTVDGATLEFRRAVIATGTRPAVPPVRGLESSGYLTNETVFGLDAPPASMLVLGGGPIGVELAQALARLGTRVTLVEVRERILPNESGDAAGVLHEALTADGVDIVTSAECIAVRPDGPGYAVRLRSGGDERDVQAASLLVAAGRAPNVEGLGLETAGVEHTAAGVKVDAFLRTTNRRIFAAGDVAGALRFTHVADAHARIVVGNALFFGRSRHTKLVVPRVTYTDPEVAQVGMTEEEATARGIAIETIRVDVSALDRARIDGDTRGFLKVHLARGSDRLLGATLVGHGAGDMIAEAALAMTAGRRLRDIGRTIHPYPTRAEIFRKAADAWRRRRLTPRARSLLAGWFRFLR